MTRHHDSDDNPHVDVVTRPTGIVAMFNMIGGVSGLVALLVGTLAYGELRKEVSVNTKRLDNIESSGSPGLQSLTRVLAGEAEIRRETDNTTNKRIEDMRVDFGQRVANITGLLERMVEQETQLIALLKAQNQIQNSKP